ncbi:MAG: acyl carrier protein [Granulosicoccus sp.]|nr:acyl carrier protein [Granulosicoccus sp.]
MNTDTPLYKAIMESMQSTFPELTQEELIQSSAGDGHWNSLAHLRLIMKLESTLGIKVPSDSFAHLTDLHAIAEFLERRAA